MTVTRLFHDICLSERKKVPTHPTINARRGLFRYHRIMRRIQTAERYLSKYFSMQRWVNEEDEESLLTVFLDTT